MAQEVELKFDIGPEGGAAIRHGDLPGLGTARPKRQDSIYYDTPDGALRRDGFSLRVRRSGGRYIQTVKRDRGQGAGLFVRGEWESEVPGFAPDLSTIDAPLNIPRKGLVPLVRTRVRRTSWQIRHKDSWIEVALDEGSVSSGGAHAPFGELELELLNGAPDAVFDLAGQIGDTAPLRLGVLSKIERGYALSDGKLGQAAKAESLITAVFAQTGDAFHLIASSCVRHFRLNEMALLETRKPEALHQARVAIRRLRSALSLFRPVIEGDEQKHFNAELRWLGRQLSEARNLDVLIDRAGGGTPLCTALQPLRARAYGHVETSLRSPRTPALFLKLTGWLELGAWRQDKRAGRDLATFAAKRLERQWRRIKRSGDDLASLDPEGRHRLRIRIKKLRYATEFVAGLYAEGALSSRNEDFLAALKSLQERLGDLNDAWTAETLASSLPEELRVPVRDLHPAHDQQDALKAAEKALGQASKTAGYWNPSA